MASWLLRLPAAMTVAPSVLSTWTNIRPIGPIPMTTTVSPSIDPGLLDGAQHAGEGFDEGRLVKSDFVGQDQQVLADDPLGDLDVLGVGAVDELKILAEVGQVPLAEEALVARARVGRDDPHPGGEAVHPVPDFLDDPGEFVAEDGRRDDHAGVESLPVHLQVGAAGQRRLDADQHFAATDARNRYLLDPDVALPVEHGGGHLFPADLN